MIFGLNLKTSIKVLEFMLPLVQSELQGE